MNRSPVTNLAGLKQLVSQVPKGESVILQIERSRGLQYLAVELD